MHFVRVILALERCVDVQLARELLRLFVRAAEEKRLLRSWAQHPVRRRRYRVFVRDT